MVMCHYGNALIRSLLRYRRSCDRWLAIGFAASEQAAAVLAVRGLNAVLFEQPDLLGRVQFEAQAVAAGQTADATPEILRVMALLEIAAGDSAVLAQLLKTARLGCFMHESNRQAFVKAGLIEAALGGLDRHPGDEQVVVQAVMTLRALTRDDDPRVPFGKANDHVVAINKENRGLTRLLAVLRHASEAAELRPTIAAEIFKTLSQLGTRDEFCKEIVELGCLDFALPALERFCETEAVAHAGCAMLRAVAGNDEVKKIIAARGGIGLIIDTMQSNLRSAKVAEQGSAALAAICLKQPGNATAIAAANGPHVIVKTMYMHPDAIKLQRQACMVLRNMVVRNPELIDVVLGEGAESAINICLKAHKDCADEAKAALRDLHCKVELKERWTGEIKTGNFDIDGSVRTE